jgi:anti-sigma-K factor RskA
LPEREQLANDRWWPSLPAMMTCEHCREELVEYALGHLSTNLSSAMDEHLAACAACRRELDQVQAAWSALALALPPAAPRPEVFDRVLAGVESGEDFASPQPRPSQEHRDPSSTALSPKQRLLSYALAASVAAALAGGAIYVRSSTPSAASGNALADPGLRDLAARLGNVQQLERMLNRENVKLASLHATSGRVQAGAYIVWDFASRQWHFYALGLAPAPAGKTYQLWAIVDDAAPLAGPTFNVDASGVGAAVAEFPMVTPGVAVRALVTLEPLGGSQAPSTDVLLESAL